MTEGTYIHVHSLLNSTVWQKAPAMKVRAVNADILTIQSIAQYECKIIILIPHHKSQIRIQATINKYFRLKETHWAPARTLQLLLGCITDVTPTHPHTCTQLYTQAHQTYAHSNHAHVYSLRLHPRSPTPTPTPPPPPTPTPTPPHHILAHTHTFSAYSEETQYKHVRQQLPSRSLCSRMVPLDDRAHQQVPMDYCMVGRYGESPQVCHNRPADKGEQADLSSVCVCTPVTS